MYKRQKGFPPSDKTEMLTDYLNGIDPNYLKDDEVKWNFTKFVIDRKGNVVGRFEPVVKPKEMEAVSYTHLDVYKRQRSIHGPPDCGGCSE